MTFLKPELAENVEALIRTIPDFPEKNIDFKDITGIFQEPDICKEIIQVFASKAEGKVDVVCGIESRGFLFGLPIALALNLPFVLIRKKGKLPPPTIGVQYELEYGSSEIEIIKGQIQPGQRVLIHDDVLATGGTAKASSELIEKMGAGVSVYSFLLEIEELNGRQNLENVDIYSLIFC